MATRLDLACRVVERIGAIDYGCCLVGGLAVSLRARERFTKDIDFAVATATDREAEAVARDLFGSGFVPQQVLEQTERSVIATIRFALPGGDGRPELDLLFGCCGIEREIVEAAEPFAISDAVTIPVARLGHLIAMKVLSENDVRVMDRSDLHAMLAVASPTELRRARLAIDRITAAGFHRGKDLQAVLRSLLGH